MHFSLPQNWRTLAATTASGIAALGVLGVLRAYWRSSRLRGSPCRVLRAVESVRHNVTNTVHLTEDFGERLRLLQINVWSGSTYEMDWWKLDFVPYAFDDCESRYRSLVEQIRQHDPDVICVNESMPCFAFAERLANDLAMDCCVHLGVAGICIGPLRFPHISEGDAILAKPHLRLEQLGRRKLTGCVFTNEVSLNLDDATQVLAARVTLPSGLQVAICCTHWHASLLDDPMTRRRLIDLEAAGEAVDAIDAVRQSIRSHTNLRKQEAVDTAAFAELVASSENSFLQPTIPVIVSGDLNTVSDTEEMLVMKDSGFTSATDAAALHVSRANASCDFATWDPANPNVALQIQAGAERGSSRGRVEKLLYEAFSADRRQLDHVLFKNPPSISCAKLQMSDCTTVLNAKFEGVVPSDHYGLLVEFILKH